MIRIEVIVQSEVLKEKKMLLPHFHQWIEYDLLYVRHVSLMLDAKIVAATLLTLGGKVTHVPASMLVGQPPARRAA